MQAAFTVEPAGDQGVMVQLGDRISAESHARVMECLAALDRGRPALVRDVVPGYASVLVVHDAAIGAAVAIEAWVRGALGDFPAVAAAGRLVRVPVWYGDAVGWDLADLARERGVPPGEIAALHVAPEYRVHLLGFRPGFPYLAGLDPRLAASRLPTPRAQVPAGSVGIGGAQTGIYPVRSPGGWRIIGRTPLRLFDPARAEPFLLAVGDRVRFEPIDQARFRELGGQIGDAGGRAG